MNRGYVKVYRKIGDSGLMQIPNTFALFMFILLNATHKDMKLGSPIGVINLKRGQYVSGRKELASKLKQSQQQIRTSLDRLVQLQILTITATNRYSVYTIVNYDLYQDNAEQSTSNATIKQPTDNQQITTKQELKNLRTKKEAINIAQFLDECKTANQKPIPENDPIFDYADKVGIDNEMLAACWRVFKESYLSKHSKKYADWRATYRNAVKRNWYKLWFIKEGEPAQWTTAGEQARREAA